MAHPPLIDIEIRLLLEAVYQRYQHDFRDYAVASMRRRVHSAMEHFGCSTVSQLQERVLHQPETFAGMLQFFTVQVSDMFRDPAYFLALRRHVVPVLRTYPSIKVWVAGCSSGEEAWSLAILLHEEGLLERSLIYATDINAEALRTAQAGIYAVGRLRTFRRNYTLAGGAGDLSDYYTQDAEYLRLDPALGRHMVCADHSLATDSVFSEVHLVSCRNVLIYFNRALQDRATGLFVEALVHRGFLGLGSRESLRFTTHADRFEEFVATENIYQRV
ncbi:CheR family methyltransferase [Bordetella sp. 2513F-2]